MADALGDDDDEMLLAGFLRGLHLGDDVALQVVRNLRDQRYKRPHRDARVQRDVPGIAPHDLHNTAAVVALCGVAQLVDHFHSGIHGRIIADGVIAAGDIVVDGARKPHTGDSLCRHIFAAAE